jgi:hypothetical protein
VQYAPSACNPNFPTTCTALGTGTIQRVVGEDSSSCKYTVLPLASNSLLFYNASTGLVNWANGTTDDPVYLSPSTTTQTSGNLLGLSALSGNNGQVVEVMPTSPVTQATFPIVPIGGSTVNWGTIENIVPNQGVVYKNASNVVAQAPLGTAGQILTMVGGVPAFANAPDPAAFIDARSVNISYASVNSLNVTFGQLVLTNAAGDSVAIKNALTYTLNLGNSGLPNTLDAPSLTGSTYYYVFAIYNPTAGILATLGSLNPTSPTLPTGYTYFRLIGLFRTNASSQIDPFYNQNGRIVNLGQTANVVVTTQATQATNKYWSGAITYVPYQYACRAFLRFALVGAAGTQNANIIISNVTAGSTGGTQPPLAQTSEVYAAITVSPAYVTATNSTFGTAIAVIPNSSLSYYNVYTTGVLGPGDSFTLQISGYELSFL